MILSTELVPPVICGLPTRPIAVMTRELIVLVPTSVTVPLPLRARLVFVANCWAAFAVRLALLIVMSPSIEAPAASVSVPALITVPPV